MKTLYIMRGLPGSGKSTRAKQLRLQNASICDLYSTDDYWERPDGTYDFNIDLIKDAHIWNQQRTHKGMQACVDHIIIDNVNTTLREMMPYIKLGVHYGYAISLVESNATWKFDVEECYYRNTHGVPYSTILRMYHEWESTDIIKEELSKIGVKVQ